MHTLEISGDGIVSKCLSGDAQNALGDVMAHSMAWQNVLFLLINFHYGSLDESTVVGKLCNKDLFHHDSTSSLQYHLNEKHVSTRSHSSGKGKRQ